MIPRRPASFVLAVTLMGLTNQAVDAGWPFSRKSNDCCPVCEQEQPKPKKKSLMSAEDAPASGVVDLVPARFTTVRADRRTEEKKDTSASADAEKMQLMEKRLKDLDQKVNQLSLEIETLVHVLENPKK